MCVCVCVCVCDTCVPGAMSVAPVIVWSQKCVSVSVCVQCAHVRSRCGLADSVSPSLCLFLSASVAYVAASTGISVA